MSFYGLSQTLDPLWKKAVPPLRTTHLEKGCLNFQEHLRQSLCSRIARRTSELYEPLRWCAHQHHQVNVLVIIQYGSTTSSSLYGLSLSAFVLHIYRIAYGNIYLLLSDLTKLLPQQLSIILTAMSKQYLHDFAVSLSLI